LSLFVGVDVGASKIRVCISSGSGLVEKKLVTKFPSSGEPDSVARIIAGLAEKLLEGRKPAAIGVGSIGPLDLRRGWVVNAPNASIKSFPLREPLEKTLGCRVVLANDCAAAVWGEYMYGGGRGFRDLGFITISSGIGGGFIVDGKLLVGWRGNAHEVGHLVLDYKSRLKCGCGGRGHWEALASGSRLRNYVMLRAREERIPGSRGWRTAYKRGLEPEELYALAREGDEFALMIVDELNRIHAAGIASVIAAYDPQVIFLGGAVFLRNKELIMQGITRYLREYSIHEPPIIMEASFGEDAVLVGALALAENPPSELSGAES